MTYDDVLAARDRTAGRLHVTPVLTCSTLDELAGCELFFKCESLQKTGSFKPRGALNAVLRLEGVERVVTDSSGNFGQALAWSARASGIEATIVMPSDAPQVKQDAVRGYGGSVVLCPPTLAGRLEVRTRVADETGAVYVPPFDHPDVIAGQGTCALELLDQVEGLSALVAPIGGGGLVGGMALVAAERGVPVFAAEPMGADDAYRSKRAGERIVDPSPKTVAKGLLVSIGEHNWPILRDAVEDVLLVDEDDIVSAMRLVWERMKLVIEPSAAVGLAAVLRHRDRFGGQRVGVVLSGGNVDIAEMPV
ncbi:MAG: pyridoxal-phosphate dependent enzyme [Proteobacteria bacterium]|nr:pyridoxal-phosphate dependent enzyme [Pseudomonadota bacterium]MCP4918741.1 pyridoxal-phosphate dependent enzyme [Pseudomonadota bacterium]